ncbi:thioredoxin-like protein [Amylostereum chailletii]|nr:thioredoxin-like protein [Amylostereum chailletii]
MTDAPRRSARLAKDSPPAPATSKAETPAAADEEKSSSLAPIEIGDTLPSFILKNEQGEDVDVAAIAAEKGIVLFSVPAADTRASVVLTLILCAILLTGLRLIAGCTTQACGFRDAYPDFSQYDFEVYCISHDTAAAQQRWQTKKELPYPLLSDPKRELIGALGAKNASGKTTRAHFVFTKGGKLVEKKLPVTPKDSPPLALETVKALSAKAAL